MRSPAPFHRATAYANTLLMIATGLGVGSLQYSAAIAALPPYASRGKGRGSTSRSYPQRSKYMPHQGWQEKLRREIGGWKGDKRELLAPHIAALQTKHGR